ncbi:MAG TPA: membrane protein insertase YidC [Candidatus Sulfotelmatobacter sp.]|nr:membrane protein insertase YidC [Candidatus Sulfotelmatobacter sp.]
MEKRAILAAILMAGVLLLYQVLFIKSPEHPAPTPDRREVPQGTAVREQPKAAPPGPAAAVPRVEVATVPERTAIIDGPLYRAVVDSRGGRLDDWTLHYRGEKSMVVSREIGPPGLTVSRSGSPAEVVPFAISPDTLKLGPDNPKGQVRLIGEDGYGLRITQDMTFAQDSYLVESRILVENRNNVPQRADIELIWRAPVQWGKDAVQKFQGQHPVRTVRFVGTSVQREDLHKIPGYTGPGHWVGLESEWYLTAIIPDANKFQIIEAKRSEAAAGGGAPSEFAEIGVKAALPDLAPGQSWEGRVSTYMGPKEFERLKSLGVGLEKSIYFGGFPIPQAYGGLPMEWLAVPILWVMHLFYAYIGNYGVAIILLTVITKVLFFPLTIKSMTSMRAMQSLQPQINALRSKFKSDPQRLQQETMALYRTHKVNPLGGCLPMVVQIPIFYALYVALSVSVELQNQPFICFGHIFGVDLWICDLASHDPTYVLPLLMGASMFIQQKMTPVMGDPRQARMMLFMPVVFTFMFLNLPAGLVLYWTLSNVFQIAQQKYMERIGNAEKGLARSPKKA